MQYQNDDMDELFRRAADGYPLKIQEGNWDAVAGKLSAPVATAARVSEQNNKKNNYKIVTLLLLLLIGSGTTIMLILNGPNRNFNNKGTIKNANNIKVNIVNKQFSEYKQTPSENNEGASVISLINQEKKTIKKPTLEGTNFTNIISSNPEIPYTKELVENKIETTTRDEKKIYEIKEVISDLNNETSLANPLKNKLENNSEKKHEIENKTDASNTTKEKRKKEKKFYVGVFAGPQFNQIKSQGFSNAGSSAGVVVGINLSKKLAVETGLFLSQKKYYSSGKYFNMKTADPSMPVGMKVISLNGKSNIVEIPVKAKYNFKGKNKANFFATAGATSYILTNENNKYLVELNGNQQKLPANYAENKRYFDAALNVSAGYEYKLKQTTLRIEPYVQVPLKKIGVGSMPLMSTGINVGITLPIH